MTARRTGDERGTGGIEGLAFGVLIFVFGTLIVTNAWGVIDAKLAASAAAREAARAYVEGSSQANAQATASAAGNAAMAGSNRTLSSLQISQSGGTYERCGTVVVVAQTEVPRVALPLLASTGGTYVVTARHTEIIDPYSSGLAGTARC